MLCVNVLVSCVETNVLVSCVETNVLGDRLSPA